MLFGEKTNTRLRALLNQVHYVWEAPNDWRLGAEIEKIEELAQEAEPYLHWFQRELWDVGFQFEETPDIPRLSTFIDDANHHESAERAPRIDPLPVKSVRVAVHAKLTALNRELHTTSQMIEELEHRRDGMVSSLWRVGLF